MTRDRTRAALKLLVEYAVAGVHPMEVPVLQVNLYRAVLAMIRRNGTWDVALSDDDASLCELAVAYADAFGADDLAVRVTPRDTREVTRDDGLDG